VWCDQTAIGVAIRQSTWAFPIIEIFHIFGLTLLFGTVFAIDLRLLDRGLRQLPVSMLSRNLRPWMYGGLLLALATGILLFLSEALKCYGNDGFRFKMACLFPALLFHCIVFPRVTQNDDTRPVARQVTAFVSMILWLGVGIGGRAIGFV